MKRNDKQTQQDKKALAFERTTMRRLDGAQLTGVEGGGILAHITTTVTIILR